MYYIVNHTNHIIAADKALLELLSVDTIGELHQNIALNSISLEITNDDEVDISTLVGSTTYAISTHTLTSVLGDMTLIVINDSKEVSDKSDMGTFTTDENDFSLLDDEPITFNDGPVTLPSETREEEETISILEDDKPFDLIMDDEPFILDEVEEPAPEVEEPAEIKTVEEEEKHPEETETETETATATATATETETETATATDSSIKTEDTEDTEDNTPIVINVSEISQKIGISEEDYNAFLNEYIDTALTLEEDLKSTQTKKRSHAVTTLSHLSHVLHLPVINQIITDIEKSDENEQSTLIRSFYNTLARLTTSEQKISETQEIPDTISEKPEETPKEEAAVSKSFGTIDLSDVKPIHFDFQLEEAANDLSLPTELIEEFVIDFIDQAHVETENMLRAYENGDLDTIQKIGHLLKGTSSNLRINPLADTLYKIQFCEDSSQLEDLIKEYWAHFLSFEHQINIISK